ncbi:MAG: hypothetical protein ACXAEU_00880 [Candidatus Hodarchaeales archaeon]|jgi:hypothetical protein
MIRSQKKFAISIIGIFLLLSIFSIPGTQVKPVSARYEETVVDTLYLFRVSNLGGQVKYYLRITTRVQITPTYRILSQSLYFYYIASGWWPPIWGVDLYYRGNHGGPCYWRATSPTVNDNGKMYNSFFKPTDSDSFTGLRGQTHIELEFYVYHGWAQWGRHYSYSI